MFKILFAILPVIYLAGNGYLYWRTLQLISTLPLWSKVVVSVLFWTAAFSMFISLALRDAGLSDLLLRLLYMTGSIWMVFLLYCVILLSAFVLYSTEFLNEHLHKNPRIFLPTLCR